MYILVCIINNSVNCYLKDARVRILADIGYLEKIHLPRRIRRKDI